MPPIERPAEVWIPFTDWPLRIRKLADRSLELLNPTFDDVSSQRQVMDQIKDTMLFSWSSSLIRRGPISPPIAC